MKTVLRAGLILIGLLTAWVACFARERGQSLTKAAEPSVELQSLTKALSGEWSLSVKFEADASMPNGVVNTGEETWRAGPGGYTVLEEEHLRMPQGDSFLLRIIWWNKTTKTFQGMECQNLLPYTCDVKGAQNDITMSWDGKQYVIDEIETSKSGQRSLWHEVWSDITPTSFTQTGEYGPPGGERKRLFTIQATKVGVASNAKTPGLNAEGHPSSQTEASVPEMQSLAKTLEGNWSTTYEFEPGAMSPTGGSGTGEEAWRIGPGGYVLMEEEHVHASSGEMYLIAFHWWDKNTNSLRGMLCNNSGPAACDFNTYSNSSLRWNGKQLRIDMEFPQGGKKMSWLEVWSGITATSFTQTGDMGEVGGPLKRAVTIRGSKVAEVVQSPFAGTWKTENPAPTPGTITYSKSSRGGEHYSNNRNSEYDFAIDGKEYPTDRPASTVDWVSTGPSSWDCVEKIRDKVTRKIHLALSAEGQTLTMTYTWFNPTNRTAAGSSVCTRVSGGPGLEGSWKMLKRIEEPDTMTIAFPVPGQMYIYVDPIDNTWAGPTDGTFMAVQSPMSPPGMTTAYRIEGARKMTSETKLGDKTLYFATLEVSEDGNTLTRTTWAPAKEDQKTVLTLQKQE